jgi:hypothetical protein
MGAGLTQNEPLPNTSVSASFTFGEGPRHVKRPALPAREGLRRPASRRNRPSRLRAQQRPHN